MPLTDLQVLLVEDHAFQRRLGMRLLADIGVGQIFEAGDGNEALVLLRGREKRFDVALIDLDLPGMDGVELLNVLAKEKLVDSVAVVSAMDQGLRNSVELLAKKSGLRVLGAIEKPLNLGKLAKVLGMVKAPPEELEERSDIQITAELLDQALTLGQIEPYFQPQAELVNGKIVGVEALARWRHPCGKVLPASVFVDELESAGLARRLTDLMVKRSAHWWRIWSSDGLRPRISVNVSAPELSNPDIADRYASIVADEAMPADMMLFEVTEGVVLYDIIGELGALTRLRLKGFGLAIDDFGTGHSSITKLTQLPFTELKIDRSFVENCQSDHRKQAAIEASLQLAKRLDLSVVAEGVQQDEEWRFLSDHGCHVAQGWLIARAAPGEQLAETIRRWRYSPN